MDELNAISQKAAALFSGFAGAYTMIDSIGDGMGSCLHVTIFCAFATDQARDQMLEFITSNYQYDGYNLELWPANKRDQFFAQEKTGPCWITVIIPSPPAPRPFWYDQHYVSILPQKQRPPFGELPAGRSMIAAAGKRFYRAAIMAGNDHRLSLAYGTAYHRLPIDGVSVVRELRWKVKDCIKRR